ncbi:MAG TPA: permease-like cell division protein FtsX [Candidatus Paceibacterota bacterium]|nr:permease-like cell division protein FtsX [Candidatus Paceibacterota bacterium]
MDWVQIKRVFRAGFLDFWRNGFVSLASILVMTVTLFVVGLTLFAGVILNSALADLRDKADVNVYFTQNAPEDQVLELQKSLQALPQVQSVEYLSADEALAEFRERHQNDQLTLQALQELGDNPLGAVLNIKAKDIAQYDAIAQFLEQQQALSSGSSSIIDKVNYFDAQHRQALDRLQHITESSGRLGLVVILLLVLVTLAISFNTLRLAIYTSREEIQVMRLVGAGTFYIRAPFMVEGVLYGLISGLITLLLLYPLTYWLGASTESFFGGINVFSYYVGNFFTFFGIIVGTGVVLGAVASYLAVRRYLKI